MPRKPLWTEGLFVSQHHFQVQDAYHESLLHERVTAMRRYGWGVLEWEVDEALLQAGQFRLVRFAAVMPDGLVVRCGPSFDDPTPEPRSFEGLFGPELPLLAVMVGLANEGAVAGNVGLESEPTTHRRFTRGAQSVADFNIGGGQQEVDIAVPNLRVFFGPERRDRVLTLPIAQLVRQAGGRVIVRDTFVPPVLHIGAAPFVRNGLQRVLGAMGTLQRELATGRKLRNTAMVEFHAADTRRFWLLHTLNTAIPELSHLLATERAHPEEIYVALARVYGQLCTFAADADPRGLPAFNYNELGDVFEHIFARILSMLVADTMVAYTEIPLEGRPDGMFVGRIAEPNLVNQEFFVAVSSTLPDPVVRERVPQLLKIADWNRIVQVATQAGHGVRVEVVWNAPSALPLKPGVCFFRIKREGRFWEDVAKTCSIALFLPREPDWKDTALSVYAVDPKYLH